jgi:hypothetical protein
MITLSQILSSRSAVLEDRRVKLVRHKDHREEYREVIKDKKALLEYQRVQESDVFRGCDYIISFIGLERRRAVFFGVFKVNGCEVQNEQYEYDLEPVPAFEEFTDRLVIDWGGGTRNWHQWFPAQDKDVVEILPAGYVGHFSGLLNFVLDFDELQKLVRNPDANIEWQRHLSAVSGIYLILDNQTGHQYIGSACGKEGLWQRWSDYAATGHGGNRELIALHKDDPDYARNFKFSILQSLPSNMTSRDVVKIENLYKDKLGPRAHGLNRN